MARHRWLLVALSMTPLAACDADGCLFAPERRFSYLVTHHLERGGPVAACCTIDADRRARNAASFAGCEAEAPVKCAFARDARVEVVRVDCRPHSCEQAGVVVNVSGPNGKATCQFEAKEGSVLSGTCTPEATSDAGPP